jgi:hypothetical protein
MLKPIRWIQALCLFIILLNPLHTPAAGLMGSDLGWTQVGQDSFLFKLTLYRDCNAQGLKNAKLNFHCATSGMLIKSVSLAVPTAIDITPLSSGSSNCSGNVSRPESRCDNPASAFPYGIEQYECLALVVLNAAVSCCEIDISYEDCCRSTGITTGLAGKGFYSIAKMNRCLSSPNSSPQFSRPPVSIICIGHDYTFSQGLINTDTNSHGALTDSMVYELVSPKGANGADLSYSGLYNYSKPFFFWGFPNAAMSKPRGFHLNAQTGELSFRPLKIEQSVLTIKLSEYRQGVKISEVRRDMQFIVISCPNNHSPVLSSTYYHEVCAEDSLSFAIACNDFDVSDTLLIEWDGGISEATWTTTNCIDKHPTAHFSWVPGDEKASTIPYVFTVSVKDNKYPVSGVAIKTFSILVKARPEAEINVIDSGCANYYLSAKALSGTNPSFEWTGDFTPGFQQNGDNIHHRFNDPGLYTYTMTIAANTCSRSYVGNIAVDTFLGIKNLGDFEVCKGDSVSLTAAYYNNSGPVQFKWNTGHTSQGIDLKINGDSTIILQIVDSIQCMVSDTILVRSRNLPSMQLDATHYTCYNSVASIYPDIDLDKEEIQQIYWRHASDSSIFSFDSNLLVSKQGLYICELMDTFGCLSLDSTEVIMNPEVVAYADDEEVCLGEKVTLKARSTGSKTANVHYAWFADSILLANTQELSVSPKSSKQYTLRVKEELNGILCEDSIVVNVLVKALPRLSSIPIDSSCKHGFNSHQRFLNNYAHVIPANAQLNWSSSGNTITQTDSGFLFHPDKAEVGTQWLYVTASDPATTCSATDSVMVHIYPQPQVFAGFDQEVCSTDSLLKITGIPVSKNGIWTSRDRVQLSDTSSSWYFNPALVGNRSMKEFEFYYTITDKRGCTNLDTLDITVYKTPETDAGLDQDICVNADSFFLGGLPAHGHWSGHAIINDTFYPSLAGAGSFLLEYEVENHICSAKDTMKIRVNPLPEISISTEEGRSSYCKTEGLIKLLAFPEGGIWNGLAVDSSGFNSLHSSVGEGLNTLSYTYTDSNACTNSKDLDIHIVMPPEVRIVQDKKFLCVPDTFSSHLMDQHSDSTFWLIKPHFATGTIIGDLQNDSIRYYPSSDDIERGYFVLYALAQQTEALCSQNEDSIVVQISEYPKIEFSAVETEGCAAFATQFINQSDDPENDIVDWQWYQDTQLIATGKEPYFTFSDAGIYNISLSASNKSGCSSRIEKPGFIQVYDNPTAEFKASTNYTTITESLISFENLSRNNTDELSFNWDFGDPYTQQDNYSNNMHPEHKFSDSGQYVVTLVAINEHGCSDSFAENIEITPNVIVYVPNAFTPDNQGPEINNVFRVSVLYGSSFDFKVYSRWGELIYESHDYASHGWDGTYLNSENQVPLGSYLYVLHVGNKAGKDFLHTGTISVLR